MTLMRLQFHSATTLFSYFTLSLSIHTSLPLKVPYTAVAGFTTTSIRTSLSRSVTTNYLFHSYYKAKIDKSEIMPTTRSGKISSHGHKDTVSKRHDFSMFAYDRSSDKETKETNDRKRPRKTTDKKSPAATKRTTSKTKTKTKITSQISSNVSPSKQKAKKAPTTPSPKKKKSPTSKTPPSSSRKRQRIEPGSLDPPPNWESIYTLVEELRADRTAPMDSDGGGALPERHRGDKVFRYQVLTALMLSSQTKDAVVGDAMRALQKHGLDVESINTMDVNLLSSLIGKVGFYNNKTKFMKETAEILLRDYGGDIPETAEGMMKLPGVGPKMAFIIESIAFQKSTGIGVDTHMHRIFNILKWVNSKTPEQTREQLEGWLPRDKWGELNALFVGFGQESQQQKEKILKKALVCSRPKDALLLLSKVGVDLKKEGEKFGLQSEIKEFIR